MPFIKLVEAKGGIPPTGLKGAALGPARMATLTLGLSTHSSELANKTPPRGRPAEIQTAAGAETDYGPAVRRRRRGSKTAQETKLIEKLSNFSLLSVPVHFSFLSSRNNAGLVWRRKEEELRFQTFTFQQEWFVEHKQHQVCWIGSKRAFLKVRSIARFHNRMWTPLPPRKSVCLAPAAIHPLTKGIFHRQLFKFPVALNCCATCLTSALCQQQRCSHEDVVGCRGGRGAPCRKV